MNYKFKYFSISTYSYNFDYTLTYNKKFIEINKNTLYEHLGGFSVFYARDFGPVIINLNKAFL